MTLVHRSRRLILAGGSLLFVLALAAPALAATIAVDIVDKTYSPADIVIAEGDTVTWTVTKSINEPHSVTSGAPTDADAGTRFDSGTDGLQDNGASYSFTFDTPGTYAYFCKVHPVDMHGTVLVLAEGASPGEEEAGIPMERRLIGAGILAGTLVILFGAALVWRRMNAA